MECEDAMSCLYGFTETDIRVFEILSEQGEAMKIDAIAEIVERDRGTVFRSLKRLQKNGFVSREQVNYASGGYYHVYYVQDPATVVSEMQNSLNEIYSEIDIMIDKFREKYSIEG